ncbi:hypothetical protein ABBQ32_005211 [Trebouxia sp. C0010 RCD-2024]
MEQLQQQIVEQHLLATAQRVEDQLDNEMHQLQKLDEDDMESLRQQRLQQMKKAALKKQEWLRKGHGEYNEIASEKEFFAEMKGEERMICHFYRENWPCKVMDKHLQILAKQHVETKFIKIHAEKSPFLTERLKVFMLPTLACVKKEKTVDYVVGFDELGGSDDFSTHTLAARLSLHGLITYEGSEDYGGALNHNQHKKKGVQRSVRYGGERAVGSDDEDSDFE